jgi:putative lipoic acid-binding regulatory protein
MTFGKIKTAIEKNILESYKTEREFKKTIKEFKENVLKNKDFSKLYNLYDQLNAPSNMNESDAKEFIQEGVSLIQKLLPNVKLPKLINEESSSNNYKDIDTLVYSNNINLSERIQCRKNIINILTSPKQEIKESIKIPVSTMIKIANQKLSSYLESLNEGDKKELVKLLTEDTKSIEISYNTIKESALNKLSTIIDSESDSDIVSKINETIDRLSNENFTLINYVRLKSLEESI